MMLRREAPDPLDILIKEYLIPTHRGDCYKFRSFLQAGIPDLIFPELAGLRLLSFAHGQNWT